MDGAEDGGEEDKVRVVEQKRKGSKYCRERQNEGETGQWTKRKRTRARSQVKKRKRQRRSTRSRSRLQASSRAGESGR